MHSAVSLSRASGFSERQARFLVLVLEHSGVCLPRQYRAFARIAHGQQTHRFFNRLITGGFATTDLSAPAHAGRIYHVQSKAWHRAMGESDHPHRRAMSIGRAVERLMVLDAVLAEPDITWLGLARDKVATFTAPPFSVPPDPLPHTTVGGVARAFPDPFPIGLAPDGSCLFLYLITTPIPTTFRTRASSRSPTSRRRPSPAPIPAIRTSPVPVVVGGRIRRHMAARFTRLLVALGLLLGMALPSAAAAVVRLPTSQETAVSPVPARGADAANARSYFGARYYRAELGRFTTVDPELNVNAALLDPQRWNRYAYVRNNPLRYVDPDGKDIWDLLAGMGNAIKSNFTFGVGRQTGGNTDFRVGQFAGDLISIPVGLAETVTGGGVGLAGLAAEGPSFGTSTVVVAGGVMVMTQGGTAAIAGAAGAGTFLAESANSLSGGGRSAGLSNAEAREQAKELGFKGTKDAPFNSHGKPVFQKGDFFITPDRDSHKGGVWKMFDRKGNRVGTFNADLTERIGQ